MIQVRMRLALAAMLLLSACSGGDDEPIAAGQAKDYYQTYHVVDPQTSAESLILVNVADFTQRIDLGAIDNPAVLYAGSRSGDAIANYRPHSTYFVRDGAWHRVGLRHGVSQVPVRVSADTFTQVCFDGALVEQTVGSDIGAVLLYTQPGPDASCWTEDDVHSRIGVDDSPTAAPRPGVIGNVVVEFRSAAGTLTGLLAHDQFRDGTVRVYPADGSAAMVLGTAAAVELLVQSGNTALVSQDGLIRRVDAAGSLGEPLHTLAQQLLTRPVVDENFLYFVDGITDDARTLYRVALDGLSPAEAIFGPAHVDVVGETAASIVLALHDWDAGTTAIGLLGKGTDGSALPQVVQEFGLSGVTATSVRAPVLYSVFDYYAYAATAYRIDANDAISGVAANSSWTGLQYAPDTAIAGLTNTRQALPIGAFRVDGFAISYGFPGGIVRHVDLATGGTRVVMQIVQDEYFIAIARGTIGVAIVFADVPEPQSWQADAVSFDLDGGRLERHSNGTLTHEFPYAY